MQQSKLLRKKGHQSLGCEVEIAGYYEFEWKCPGCCKGTGANGPPMGGARVVVDVVERRNGDVGGISIGNGALDLVK